MRLFTVDETESPHSPVLPTTTVMTSRPSSRVSGRFGSLTSNPQSSLLRAKPPTSPRRLRDYAHPLSICVSSYLGPLVVNDHACYFVPYAGIATAGVAGGDWKLAMTPENIRPLLGNAVHARLCACVEELVEVEGNGGGSLGYFLVYFCSYISSSFSIVLVVVVCT